MNASTTMFLREAEEISSARRRNGVLSVAPMLQWTDTHWRFLMRQITSHTLLYTEMIMDNAILYNKDTRIEDFLGPRSESSDGPVAVQLGGSDPMKLAEAASICESYARFNEINVNCGCPSNKAKRAGFGAELMLDPNLVMRIMYEMNRRVTMTDLSVKCRLGVSGRDTYDDLVEFIRGIESVGIRKVILHARSCLLRGLSPAQNRNIPPLKYPWVYRLMQDFPGMHITLNGGLDSFDAAEKHLQGEYEMESSTGKGVDGVMMGRAAYKHPWIFADADRRFFNKSNKGYSRMHVLRRYLEYCTIAQSRDVYGSSTCSLLKPLHYFFHGAGKCSLLYKHRLDELMKSYSKISNARGYVGNNSIGNYNSEIERIVMEAIEGTIPFEFMNGDGLVQGCDTILDDADECIDC